jgi:2-oxo-4-hydroxy-4-carboxy-5-ureidoimidazoline decarboxylase
VKIATLNDFDRDPFVQAIGWVFEHSPWVAERAWTRRPFRSLDHLHAAMVDEMRSGSVEEQLALLRAHPDLGARMTMSQASVGEQSSAGLDRLTADEIRRLQQLNAEYRTKFGFPFLLAVKGSTSAHVLDALPARLAREPHVEFEEGLRQVARIARYRLEEAIAIEVGEERS